MMKAPLRKAVMQEVMVSKGVGGGGLGGLEGIVVVVMVALAVMPEVFWVGSGLWRSW